MAIPRDAHYVSGTGRKQVELATGEVVKRAAAENIHARNIGYNSNYDLRKFGHGDQKYFAAWARTEQGQRALANARERGISRRQVKDELIAARNSRPHAGQSGGQAYIDFMEDYDLIGEDWVDY